MANGLSGIPFSEETEDRFPLGARALRAGSETERDSSVEQQTDNVEVAEIVDGGVSQEEMEPRALPVEPVPQAQEGDTALHRERPSFMDWSQSVSLSDSRNMGYAERLKTRARLFDDFLESNPNLLVEWGNLDESQRQEIKGDFYGKITQQRPDVFSYQRELPRQVMLPGGRVITEDEASNLPVIPGSSPYVPSESVAIERSPLMDDETEAFFLAVQRGDIDLGEVSNEIAYPMIASLLPLAQQRGDPMADDLKARLRSLAGDPDWLESQGYPRDLFRGRSLVGGGTPARGGNMPGLLVYPENISTLDSSETFRERFGQSLAFWRDTDTDIIRNLEQEIGRLTLVGEDTTELQKQLDAEQFRQYTLSTLNPVAYGTGEPLGALAGLVGGSLGAFNLAKIGGLSSIVGRTSTGALRWNKAGLAVTGAIEGGLGVAYAQEAPGIIADWVFGMDPQSSASVVLSGIEAFALGTFFNLGADWISAMKGKPLAEAQKYIMDQASPAKLVELIQKGGGMTEENANLILDQLREILPPRQFNQIIEDLGNDRLEITRLAREAEEAGTPIPDLERAKAYEESRRVANEGRGVDTPSTPAPQVVDEVIEEGVPDLIPGRARNVEQAIEQADALFEYEGNVGRLIQDDEGTIVLRRSGEPDIEIPNSGKDVAKTLEELGIDQVSDSSGLVRNNVRYDLLEDDPLGAINYNADGGIASITVRNQQGQNRTIRDPQLARELSEVLAERNARQRLARGETVDIPQPVAGTRSARAMAKLDEIVDGLNEDLVRVVDSLDLGESVLSDGRFVGGTEEFTAVRQTELTAERLTRAKDELSRLRETIDQSPELSKRIKDDIRGWSQREIERIDRYESGDLFPSGVRSADEDPLVRLRASEAYGSDDWETIRGYVESGEFDRLTARQLRDVARESGIELSDLGRSPRKQALVDRVSDQLTSPTRRALPEEPLGFGPGARGQPTTRASGQAAQGIVETPAVRQVEDIPAARPEVDTPPIDSSQASFNGEPVVPNDPIGRSNTANAQASQKAREATPKVEVRNADGVPIGETPRDAKIDIDISVNTDDGVFDIRMRTLDDPVPESGVGSTRFNDIGDVEPIANELNGLMNREYGVLRKVSDWFRWVMTGNMTPRHVRALIDGEKGMMKAELQRMAFNFMDIQRGLKRAGVKVGTKEWELINLDIKAYFEGVNADLSRLPSNMRKPVRELKQQRIQLSHQIAKDESRRASLVGGKSKEMETIMNNMDSYLARTYRIDIDKGYTLEWVKENRQDRYEKAVNWVQNNWKVDYRQGNYQKYLDEVNRLQSNIDSVNAENMLRLQRGERELPVPDIDYEKLRDQYKIVDNLQDGELWTRNQAENIIAEMFADRGGGFSRFITGDANGVIGGQDVSSLMRRGNVPHELRELWGEVINPLEAMNQTIRRQVNLIYNRNAQRKLATILTDLGLADRVGPGGKSDVAGYYVRLGSRQGQHSKYDELADLYVAPELKSALRGLVDTDGSSMTDLMRLVDDRSMFVSIWEKSVGYAKFTKTLINPVGYISNLIGSTFNELMQGNINPVRFMNGLQAVADRAGWYSATREGKRAFLREVMNDLQSFGLLEQNVNFNDIFRSFSQGMDLAGNPGSLIGRSKSVKDRAIKSMATLWGGTDDAGKVAAWLQETARYQKAGFTGDALKSRVADVIGRTRQMYARTPHLLQNLSRKEFLVIPFVNFAYDQLRIMINTPVLAAQDIAEGIRTGNRALTRIGASRMASFTLVGLLGGEIVKEGLGAIYPSVNRDLRSATTEDYERLYPYLAPWEKEQSFGILGIDREGNAKVYSLSYLVPNELYISIFRNARLAAANGEDATKAVMRGVWNTFAGEGVATYDLLTSFTDYDQRRKQEITLPGMTVGEQIRRRAAFLIRPFSEPGLANYIQKISNTVAEKDGRFGSVYPMDDLLLPWMGIRSRTFNIYKNFGDNASSVNWDMRKNDTEYRRMITSEARQGKDVEPLIAAWNRSRSTMGRDLIQLVESQRYYMQTLGGLSKGAADGRIRATLKEKRFGQKDIDSIMRGVPPQRREFEIPEPQ